MGFEENKLTGRGTLIFLILGVGIACYIFCSLTLNTYTKLTSPPSPTPDIVYAKELIEISEENWQCYRYPNNGDMVFEGTVRNTSYRDLRGVELRGTIYDSEGKEVGSDTGNANYDGSVQGFATVTFSFHVRDRHKNSVRCELKVEGARYSR